MNIDVFNQSHEKVSELTLSKAFEKKWNPDLVHQVVVSYISNKRAPLAHVKDRSEVRGGGKKPHAQKHTGRSRHGSSRSPLWSGGGITHGPRSNEKNFDKKINKKMKHGALLSALSKKVVDGEILVVDSLSFEDKKTKSVSTMFKKFFTRKPSVLIVTGKENKTVFQAARNIPKTDIMRVSELNVFDVMQHKVVMFEKSAIETVK
ncbi:50S ribosomal protein L4 [Candidatus Parcubacteria bacterium]|jgi:large subunit ribosomal protein L4|nr:MAG: 50S ribosomal protein L4 [Candidatus Parcubacteria bacterium]